MNTHDRKNWIGKGLRGLGIAGLATMLAGLSPHGFASETGHVEGAAVFDASSRDEATDLLGLVTTWVAHNFDLPLPSHLPKIDFVTPAEVKPLLKLLCSGDRQTESAIDELPSTDILAFYDRQTATIYLPKDWSGASPVDVSILVHEIVHHMVAAANPVQHEMSEKLAFEAQEKWLGAFGHSLETAFGIDPFTVIMRTETLYYY